MELGRIIGRWALFSFPSNSSSSMNSFAHVCVGEGPTEWWNLLYANLKKSGGRRKNQKTKEKQEYIKTRISAERKEKEEGKKDGKLFWSDLTIIFFPFLEAELDLVKNIDGH